MTHSTGRRVGAAALFSIAFGSLGALGAWTVSGGLGGSACILGGVVLAAAMFAVRLIGILAAHR
ncbi:hypothetical protein [Streptomyces milbemycinicus]|uniref:Uncharacterized protein n=1 Tax=Streptomyces milbemycinicus TaxID=476552 RepID=A0ABW8M325_9ACTN